MKEFSKYVGLDTHKNTIAVAAADAQRGKVRYFGEISNTPEAIRKALSEETTCDTENVGVACQDESKIAISLLQNLTRNHQISGDVLCSISTIVAQCGRYPA